MCVINTDYIVSHKVFKVLHQRNVVLFLKSGVGKFTFCLHGGGFFSSNICIVIYFHLLVWKHSRIHYSYIRANTKSQFLIFAIKNNNSAKRIALKRLFHIVCYKYIRIDTTVLFCCWPFLDNILWTILFIQIKPIN